MEPLQPLILKPPCRERTWRERGKDKSGCERKKMNFFSTCSAKTKMNGGVRVCLHPQSDPATIPLSLDTQLRLLKFIPAAKRGIRGCPAFQLWLSYLWHPNRFYRDILYISKNPSTRKNYLRRLKSWLHAVWIESSNNSGYKHPGPVGNCFFVFKASSL